MAPGSPLYSFLQLELFGKLKSSGPTFGRDPLATPQGNTGLNCAGIATETGVFKDYPCDTVAPFVCSRTNPSSQCL